MLVGWLVVYLLSYVLDFGRRVLSHAGLQLSGVRFLLAHLLVLAHG